MPEVTVCRCATSSRLVHRTVSPLLIVMEVGTNATSRTSTSKVIGAGDVGVGGTGVADGVDVGRTAVEVPAGVTVGPPVAVGTGILVAVGSVEGVAVGSVVAVGPVIDVAVGSGVSVGSESVVDVGVEVKVAVADGVSVAIGTAVAVGMTVEVAVGCGVGVAVAAVQAMSSSKRAGVAANNLRCTLIPSIT